MTTRRQLLAGIVAFAALTVAGALAILAVREDPARP